MIKPKVIFFGTGPVSLMCLEGIHEYFDIESIITKPDRKIHGKIHDHPVKNWGHNHSIPAHQVASKQELSQLFSSRPFKSQLGLVVDFGIIISHDVIEYFPKGILNSHFSLLPEWRGADPISFALLSGQKTTGVSLMLIVPELDEGDLIAQEPLDIPAEATIHTLTKGLSDLSNQMLINVLPQYLAGKIKPWPQDASKPATYSRKLTKEDGVINWSKPADQIEREIRTFLGWPGSRTQLFNKDVIITEAHVEYLHNRSWNILGKIQRGAPMLLKEPSQLGVYTADGATPIRDARILIIDRLKPAGKKEMSAADFVRGLNHQNNQ